MKNFKSRYLVAQALLGACKFESSRTKVMDAHLRDHERDRRIKFADVSDDRKKKRRGGESERKRSELCKDIAGLRITRSSRFVRVEGNKVSRFHRQTRSTGNGSLASSIKRVTYRGEGRTLEGPPEKLAAVAAIAGCNPEILKPSQPRNSPEARNTWVSLIII